MPDNQSDAIQRRMRQNLYPTEDSYFKQNPQVAGMAAEDNKVILNPYSQLSAQQKDAVALNEYSRIYMRENKIDPAFDLTPEQQKSFQTINQGKPYGSDLDIKHTILARIISGDPSVGKPTPDQIKWANQIKQGMNR